MSDTSIIAEGRAAWQRIKNRDKNTFSDWVAIGRCLIEGRRQCMAKAQVNSPFGPLYQHYMRDFLDANDMADLDSHERYGSVLIVEHLGEIEAYRASLTEAERSRCNHVNTVLMHWRRGTAPQRQGPKAKAKPQHVVEKRAEPDESRASYGPRPLRPDGDMIRRIATAMRASGKSDWYQLATIAIETLTIEDLRDLMPAKAKPVQLELAMMHA
jgi:hypothetical protein